VFQGVGPEFKHQHCKKEKKKERKKKKGRYILLGFFRLYFFRGGVAGDQTQGLAWYISTVLLSYKYVV
jgi:hypothetical protein